MTAPASPAPAQPAHAARKRRPPAARYASRIVAQTEKSLLSDPFRLAIVVLLVETISKFTAFFEFLWGLRLALITFSFCLLYTAIRPKRALDFNILRYRVPQLVVLQAVLAGLSAVFGISQGGSAQYILTIYWKTIAFALLLMASVRGVTDTRRLVKATAFAGIILAFMSVFVVHVSKDTGTATYDANDIGLIVVMTIPLALLVLQTSKGLARIIAFLGLGCVGATIPMTASRGAFIGTVAVGVALLFFLPGVSIVKRIFLPMAVVATMVILAPSSYWDIMYRTFANPTSDYNWDAGQGRKALAQRGVSYMLRYPIFGIGIGNFPKAELDPELSAFAAEQMVKHAGYRPSAPHNSWIQAGSETGIPGIVLWVALVVGSAWSVIRLRKMMPKEWATSKDPDERFVYLATVYVPIAILGYTVCATFVSFAWNDQSYVLPAISLGLTKAYAEQMNRSAKKPYLAAAAAAAKVTRPKMRRLNAAQQSEMYRLRSGVTPAAPEATVPPDETQNG